MSPGEWIDAHHAAQVAFLRKATKVIAGALARLLAPTYVSVATMR